MQQGWKKNFLLPDYLDANVHSLVSYQSNYKIIGSLLNFKFRDNYFALLEILNLAARTKISENLRGSVKLFTFIIYKEVLNKYARVEGGSKICSNFF